MITSCPNCNTHFRVTPEQLAARNGLVRCGRCANVFNGFGGLQRKESPAEELSNSPLSADTDPLPEPPEVSAPKNTGAAATERNDPVNTERDAQPVPVAVSAKPLHTLQGRIDTPPPVPNWTPGEVTATLTPFGDQPVSENDLTNLAAELATSGPETKPGALSKSEKDTPVSAESALVRPDLQERPASKRSKLAIALCLLLGILLAAQTGFLLRSEIASMLPEARPYLISICEQLSCSVSLPKQIDEITIESSEMQSDASRPNVILVTAILRNHSSRAQTYPFLEVTLTDTQGRPIARRSLASDQYSNGTATSRDGFAPGSEIVTRTAIETLDMTPSGYRLRLYHR